jgi:sortase A
VSERAAWALAFVCLGSWGAFYLAGVTGARGELNRFGVLRAAAKLRAGSPDQTFWSEERVRAWQSTLSDPDPPPLAVLRVPRIGVEVAVLEGTDDFTLNRAVGHVANTARPGSDGNSAIAAHRDGCRDARWQRGVSRRADLDRRPEDVSVLDPTPVRSLTLVTCYPFYFIGSAPRRFMSGRSEPTKRFQKGEAAERDVSLDGVPGVSTVRSRRAAYPG